MEFDANMHRCTLVIDQQLPAGLAMNAASVIGISFGKLIGNLVGPDMHSHDGCRFPGVVYAPLPVLVADGHTLRELQQISGQDQEIFSMPFSALAQSCKTYAEYGQRIASTHGAQIALVAIGLIGPKKKITRLTGNLKLYR